LQGRGREHCIESHTFPTEWDSALRSAGSAQEDPNRGKVAHALNRGRKRACAARYSSQCSPRSIDVTLICAEANDAATRTAHPSHKGFLANKVSNLQTIGIGLHNFTNFTSWYRGWIKGFSPASR